MRKLNIEKCMVTVKTPEGKVDMPYDIQDSMVDILMHPELKLTGTMLLRNNKLAQKILDCTENHVFLEEAEYDLLRGACDRIQGFDRQDVELVTRILEAPQIEVTEKGE